MIQVKEFINYQQAQELIINDWLKEQSDNIKVIDIKYSVSAFQNGSDEFSGALIIYEHHK